MNPATDATAAVKPAGAVGGTAVAAAGAVRLRDGRVLGAGSASRVLPATDLAAFESAARQRNLDKQAGFYVDRDGEVILTPMQAGAAGVADLIVLAARTIEMQLIEDHTRQQDAPQGAPVDSSQDLHWAVLPLAHPDEFADFVERHSAADAPGETAEPQSGQT
jgi:hypothetical protein